MITKDVIDREIVKIRAALAENPIDYVMALSVASGVEDKDEIDNCKKKISAAVSNVGKRFPKNMREGLERILQFYNSGEWIGNEEISFVAAVDIFARGEPIGNCWTRSSIFYVLAQNLGIDLGFSVNYYNTQHSFLRTIEQNPIIIDLNLGIDVERCEGHEDVSFATHLGGGYLNRLDFVNTPAEKVQLCRAVIYLSPERPEGYSELASVHMVYGGSSEVALELSQKAVDLGKGHPVYRGNLILSYISLGRLASASQELLQLEARYPEFEHLPKLRKRFDESLNK